MAKTTLDKSPTEIKKIYNYKMEEKIWVHLIAVLRELSLSTQVDLTSTLNDQSQRYQLFSKTAQNYG